MVFNSTEASRKGDGGWAILSKEYSNEVSEAF